MDRMLTTNIATTTSSSSLLLSSNNNYYYPYTTTTTAAATAITNGFVVPTSTNNHTTTVDTATSLYYYNVDQYILRELIRPATPKHGNLAKPRLVQPIAIRPQQLALSSSATIQRSSSSNSTSSNNSAVQNRKEGARNPDPYVSTTPLSTTASTTGKAACTVVAVPMTDPTGVIVEATVSTPSSTTSSISTVNAYFINDDMMIIDRHDQDGELDIDNGRRNSTGSHNSMKRKSRDDEDIMYYKKASTTTGSSNFNSPHYYNRSTRSCDSSIMSSTINHQNHGSIVVPSTIVASTTNSSKMMSNTTTNAVAPITTPVVPYVTPNPVQYYTSTTASQPHSNYFEPQYIVYKNNHGNSSEGAVSANATETSHSWTTALPSSTASAATSYTIVKPKAMRPIDVIHHYGPALLYNDNQYMDYNHSNHYHGNVSTTPSSTTSSYHHSTTNDKHKKRNHKKHQQVPASYYDNEPTDSPVYDADDSISTPGRSASVGMQVCG